MIAASAYRLRATKTSLYKLTRDKIADIPWGDLPLCKYTDFKRFYRSPNCSLHWDDGFEADLSTLCNKTELTITHWTYDSDGEIRDLQTVYIEIPLDELIERGMVEKLPVHDNRCVPMEHTG